MEITENMAEEKNENDMIAADDTNMQHAAEKVYTELLDAMVHKSRKRMQTLLADSFSVNLMGKLHLNKRGFINAVTGGTIKIYEVDLGDTDVTVKGTKAVIKGKSTADASIILRGRKKWDIALDCVVENQASWQMMSCRADFKAL